jgi:hypothetical protein
MMLNIFMKLVPRNYSYKLNHLKFHSTNGINGLRQGFHNYNRSTKRKKRSNKRSSGFSKNIKNLKEVKTKMSMDLLEEEFQVKDLVYSIKYISSWLRKNPKKIKKKERGKRLKRKGDSFLVVILIKSLNRVHETL